MACLNIRPFDLSRPASGAGSALRPRRHLLSLAAGLCVAGLSQAQTGAQPVQDVQVTGRAPAAPVGVAGFGDVPLSRAPFQAQVAGATQLADLGLTSVADLPALDASVADAYNAPGYWGSFRVRGFTLDPRSNFRRDGLPISGETALLLGNIERVELLKGTSGAQSGVSAPGGLVNLVVKRPRGGNQRTLTLGWSEDGNALVALDWDQSLDEPTETALRLNVSAERLDPQVRDARGRRGQFALAGRTRVGPADLLEAELEVFRQSQPSVPAFSLLGGTLPSAADIDPRTNLNNQAWTQPVVFEGQVASLRWTHEFSAQWRSVAQLMGQHLRTDDRAAFPFGCSAEDNYSAYCSDGSFDLYDFRSEGEKRTTTVAAWALEGELTLGGLRHQLSTGVQWSDFRARLGDQTYQWSGIGHIDGSAVTDPVPEPNDVNTNRTERGIELHLRDVLTLAPGSQLWIGLRHSRLERAAVRTDGSRPTDYRQDITTPWIAFSQQLQPGLTAYASWGQGVETEVVANRSRYVNAGQALPALKSRQSELGLKHDTGRWAWGLAAFDIRQPKAADFGSCDEAATCERRIDGQARHRGLEGTLDARLGAWSLRGSAMWLHARREGSSQAGINGQVPENVAQRALRAQIGYQLAPALLVQALVSHEGPRMVLPDNSLEIPGWTTYGLAARYTQRMQDGRELVWRAGIDNLTDKRAWKESPYQYEHVYLYPLEPRTLRLAVQIGL